MSMTARIGDGTTHAKTPVMNSARLILLASVFIAACSAEPSEAPTRARSDAIRNGDWEPPPGDDPEEPVWPACSTTPATFDLGDPFETGLRDLGCYQPIKYSRGEVAHQFGAICPRTAALNGLVAQYSGNPWQAHTVAYAADECIQGAQSGWIWTFWFRKNQASPNCAGGCGLW
jgi:hypothetical protein